MSDEFECGRLDRRRRSITQAAMKLFVEQGFERTTLGHIVDLAGGSLSTVYKLFGNKDGLLEAVVFEKTSSGEALIAEAVALGGSPVEALHRIAHALSQHFLDPEVVALVRIVIAHSIEDREFARRFFERTAIRTRLSLESLFAHWQGAGVAMTGSPAMLAEIFLGLFVSDVHAEAISHGVSIDHSPARLRARTDFFILGAGLEQCRATFSADDCLLTA